MKVNWTELATCACFVIVIAEILALLFFVAPGLDPEQVAAQIEVEVGR